MCYSADYVLSECRNIPVRWHLNSLTLGVRTLCPNIVSAINKREMLQLLANEILEKRNGWNKWDQRQINYLNFKWMHRIIQEIHFQLNITALKSLDQIARLFTVQHSEWTKNASGRWLNFGVLIRLPVAKPKQIRVYSNTKHTH